MDIDDISAEVILSSLDRKRKAIDLADAAYRVSAGLAEFSTVKEIYEKLTSEQEKTEILPGEETDLEAVIQAAVKDTGLRWRLECLNKSLGSLRKGDFGFLFARPETGKTAMVASEFSNMLSQSDKDFLWFNNEEENNKVILRVYQAYFGVSLEALLGNIKKYKHLFREQVGSRFKFYGIDRCNKRDVDRILQSCNPGLVVFDQLDKINGFAADREDLKLGTIYQWAREHAKRYCPVIGVCQADGSAGGVRYLTMEHVANAKTAKQAEADWIFGIGQSPELGGSSVRYISICKNKLLGDQDSRPELRHGRFESLIIPEVMRYKDVLSYE